MKRILYSLSLAGLLFSAGCKQEHFDINVSPNSATTGSINASLILPLAMHSTGAKLSTSYGWAGNWVGYWGPSGTYAPDVTESTYNLTNSFQQGQWTDWYNILFDLRTAENKAKADGQDFYEGMSIIMQTIGWSTLVDLYGNIPYSKAFDLSGNLQPSYDKGEDVYRDLITRLHYAIAKIKDADVAKSPNLPTVDIMWAGNKTMWGKFANTLILKLLIHQSQVPGFSPAAEITKINANGYGYLGAGQTAQVQPGYSVSPGKLNPFWATYEADAAGLEANTYYRANNYVLNILKNNNDQRYTRYFDPATSPLNPSNPYVGVTYGDPPSTSLASTRTSNVAGPGLAKSATQPQWILTSVEALFLQAEAVARGWITGTAQTAYEDAVKESFAWLNTPGGVATATTYLTQPGNTVSNWATVAAGTMTQQVAFIVFQKYLSLVGINNLEAWTDWRRLNVPANIPISTNTARISNTPPVRLLYPSTEYTYNAANVSAQGTINQFTSPVFWDR